MADVARWPEFMSALASVRVIGTESGATLLEMVEATHRVRDVSTSRVTFRSLEGMRVVHRGGALETCEVEWRLAPDGDSTEVVVEHRFRLGWPVIGPVLDRLWVGPRIMHPIVERSLANFKSLVEIGRSPKPGHGLRRLDGRDCVPVASSIVGEER
jgi:hypothetical protein